MHTALQDLFNEAKAPQHAGKADVHAALRPILRLGAKVQAQAAVYKEHHLVAKLDAHDHALDWKHDHIKASIDGMAAAATAFIAAGETLAAIMVQTERQMQEAETDIATWERSQHSTNAQ
jgi:hypothetical protein